MERPEHSSAFSALASAMAKLPLPGAPGPLTAALVAQARSFPIEHVSPATLIAPEISRRPPPGSAGWDQLLPTACRRWRWARKPDAGRLHEGCPATLLQAQMMNEWPEVRDQLPPGGSAPAGPVAAAATPPAPLRLPSRWPGLHSESRRAAA